MKRRHVLSPSIAMLGAALALLAACEAPPGDEAESPCDGLVEPVRQPLTADEREFLRQGLREARERWREASIDDYIFDRRRTLATYGWTPVMTVTVRAGEVQLVTLTSRGDTIFSAEDESGVAEWWRWVLVEQHFDLIAEDLDEAQWVDVTFDPELGYPTDIAIDNDVCGFGGEYRSEARDLRALSEDPVDG